MQAIKPAFSEVFPEQAGFLLPISLLASNQKYAPAGVSSGGVCV